MRRPTIIHFTLIILAGATCGFAADKVNESPFPGARPLPEDFVEPLFPGISDADAEIHRKLNELTSVNFDNLPLGQALKSISKTNKLSIIFDETTATEAQVDLEMPVTLEIFNAPVRSVLKNLFRNLDLTFFVEDAAVVVTSYGCGFLRTGIFPVSDLVTDDRKSWKTLSNLLQGETDGLWEKVDGSGGTVSMSHATKSLIIRQTPEVLGQVQRILTFLRAAKRISDHRVNPPKEPESEDVLGLGGKKKRRGKGLGGGFGGGGVFGGGGGGLF